MNKTQLSKGVLIEQCSDRVFGKQNRQYLMGISMIWIVLFHVWLWCEMSGIKTTRLIALFDKGALGVDLFLLLSAFGLQASLERNTVGRFYVNRVKRLFPVYIFFLIILFLTFERDCPLERVLLQSLCQITGFSLFKYPEFFSSGFCFDWFTPAIIFLYVLFPFISVVVKWLNKKGIIFELIALVTCVVIGVWIRENKHFPFGLLALRLPIIFLGIITYLHLKNRTWYHLFLFIVIAACLGLLSGNEEMRISLLLPPLLTSFSVTQFNIPFKKIISLVGRNSYEVYLAHIFPVAFIIPLKLTDSVLILTTITIISTLFIAVLFSYLQRSFYLMWNKLYYLG